MPIINHRAIRVVLFALLLLTVTACGGSSKSQAGRGEISVGSGGGFTGAFTGYTLRADGQVLRWQGESGNRESMEPLFTLSADSTRDCFDQLDEIRFRTIMFNVPGNMTYYVEQKRGDSSHVVRWGDERNRPPTAITTFYSRFMEMIRSHTAGR